MVCAHLPRGFQFFLLDSHYRLGIRLSLRWSLPFNSSYWILWSLEQEFTKTRLKLSFNSSYWIPATTSGPGSGSPASLSILLIGFPLSLLEGLLLRDGLSILLIGFPRNPSPLGDPPTDRSFNSSYWIQRGCNDSSNSEETNQLSILLIGFTLQ